MAEPISIQQLKDASLDVKSLEEVVNGDENVVVTTRLGETYPSVKGSIKKVFENGGLPATPFATKALMTASALVDGKYAMVTNDAVNNGLYVKTAGAWVKSGYDPVAISKSYTDTSSTGIRTHANKLNTVLNMNAYTGIHDLSFYDAIELVPQELRKELLTISVDNGKDIRTFVNNEPLVAAKWSRRQYWIKERNLEHASLIVLDKPNYKYEGFRVSSSIPDNTIDAVTAIFKLNRAYNELGEVKPHTIGDLTGNHVMPVFGYMDKNGNRLTGLGDRTNFTEVPPATAVYGYINLSQSNAHLLKYFIYLPDSTMPHGLLGSVNEEYLTTVPYSKYADVGITKDYGINKKRFVNRYFKSEAINPLNRFHISQVVKQVTFTKGHKSLINASTGVTRRICIGTIQYIQTRSAVIVRPIYQDTETADFKLGAIVEVPVDANGIAIMNWSRFDFKEDSFNLRVVVDCSSLIHARIYEFNELYGEIHPDVIEAGKSLKGKNVGITLSNFVDYGRSWVSSSQALTPPEKLVVDNHIINGYPKHLAIGDITKDHQQTTFIAKELATFDGNPNINVIVKTPHTAQPTINMMRNKSGIYQGLEGVNITGEIADSQWIHPDICYSPIAIAGYKYWMINSAYPNNVDVAEDSEIFVSNDGVNWKRVKGALEPKLTGDVTSVALPPVYWSTKYKNAFLPIPTFNELEYALDGDTIQTLTSRVSLNHDPAITTHNGYIITYTLHNFGFVANGTISYKYIVCLRTNNGIDWEIVRADGTTMPYNEINAKRVYTKDNGVRNHIAYWSLPNKGSIIGNELSPQIVKVSDTEWYLYTQNQDSRISAPIANRLNLLRYRGTNPYNFDFTNPVEITKTDSVGGKLWHFGMRYYNGVYYLMYNGFMHTSTDGIVFDTKPHPFFWRGMSTDLYKPTFVVGDDGKVKIAYGTTHYGAVPHPSKVYQDLDPNNVQSNQAFERAKIMATLTCEYSSLADIMQRSENGEPDAYVDIALTVVNQATKSLRTRLIPCARKDTVLISDADFYIAYDDMVYVSAYINTRNGGTVDFSGVSVVLPKV